MKILLMTLMLAVSSCATPLWHKSYGDQHDGCLLWIDDAGRVVLDAESTEKNVHCAISNFQSR